MILHLQHLVCTSIHGIREHCHIAQVHSHALLVLIKKRFSDTSPQKKRHCSHCSCWPSISTTWQCLVAYCYFKSMFSLLLMNFFEIWTIFLTTFVPFCLVPYPDSSATVSNWAMGEPIQGATSMYGGIKGLITSSNAYVWVFFCICLAVQTLILRLITF